MTIVSRKDAFLQKKNKYFTGKLCRNGHMCPRYVNTGACVNCISAHARKTRNHFSIAGYPVEIVIVLKGSRITEKLTDKGDIPALQAFIKALNFQRVVDKL